MVWLDGETGLDIRFERRISFDMARCPDKTPNKLLITKHIMKDWVCTQKLGTYLVATSDPTIPFNAMLEMASMIAGPLGRQEHSKAALYRRREGSRRRLLLINWNIGAI